MDTVELVGRLLISLAVVLGMIWLIARRARHSGRRGKLRSDRLIDILGRQGLSRNSAVAVIRVADRALIVGFNDASVSVLGELELDAVQARLADPERGSRAGGYDDVPGSGVAGSGVAGADSTRAGSTRPRASSHTFAHLTSADIEALRAERGTAEHGVIGHDETTRGSDVPQRHGALAGSALSPATWRQTIDALREMTVRKG